MEANGKREPNIYVPLIFILLELKAERVVSEIEFVSSQQLT